MAKKDLDYYEIKVDDPAVVYNLFKDIPLYEFYKKLDTAYVLSNSVTIEPRCNLCSGQLHHDAEGGKKMLNLCNRICHMILKFYGTQIKSTTVNDDKLCNYTSYWLYDYVKEINNFSHHTDKLYTTLNMVSQSDNSTLKNCSLNKYKTHIDEFTYRKILYEFSEIYDYIKSKLDQQDDSNIHLYCNHIKENFRYYNIIKESCKSKDKCEYYDYLEEYRQKFNEQSLLNTIYEKCKYKRILCKHGSNGNDDVPCLGPQGNTFLNLIFGNDPEDIINIVLKITIISAPILALFVILIKFTPLGKSLNKLKQERKKNGRKKKEESIQDYMKNYAAYLDSEMKNRVHLGYHAT
ncbi:PIR protein [Plasmodium vivax]|nr:PIR protein [Plasmodium vivax]